MKKGINKSETRGEQVANNPFELQLPFKSPKILEPIHFTTCLGGGVIDEIKAISAQLSSSWGSDWSWQTFYRTTTILCPTKIMG